MGMMEPRIGMIVEKTPGQQQAIDAIYPAIEEDGVPVRVHLSDDRWGHLCEWPWLVEAGMVIQQ